MKAKLLSATEIIAIVIMGFIALITGGWSSVPLAVIAGAMIGFSVTTEQGGLRRALITGLIASTLITALTYVHNTVVVTLPKIETPTAGSTSPLLMLAAVIVGTFTSGAIAYLRLQPNEQLRRYGLLGIVLFFAVAFPFFEENAKLLWANAMVVSLIYVLQALGLNIVAGYAGLLDLGYVAFFAIGGYTIAFLNSPQFNIHISFWLIIWAAAAAAAFFGLLLGTPVLPLRGDYLAIVTLGFGEIVPIVFRNLEAVTIYEPITAFIGRMTNNPAMAICFIGCGGEPFNITNGIQGINPIGRPELPGITFRPGEYTPWYFLVLGLLLVSVFFIARLRNSKLGRAWIALREDELAASAMGIDVVRAKLSAFMIGAMFSGIAGAFYGSYVSFISPSAFDFSISVIVLCMVILGGTGNIVGVILGGLILRLSDLILLDKLQLVITGLLQVTMFQTVRSLEMQLFWASLLDITQYKLLFFGLILVLMMLLRPEGLVPSATSKRKGS